MRLCVESPKANHKTDNKGCSQVSIVHTRCYHGEAETTHNKQKLSVSTSSENLLRRLRRVQTSRLRYASGGESQQGGIRRLRGSSRTVVCNKCGAKKIALHRLLRYSVLIEKTYLGMLKYSRPYKHATRNFRQIMKGWDEEVL